MTSAQSLVRRDRPVAPRTAALFVGGWLALLWLIECVDQITLGSLDYYGIHAWQLSSLPAVFVAPFLHADWAHLIGNSLPFAVLGFLVLLGGAIRAAVSSVVIVLVSGASAWLLSAPNTITIGASGLIFGWLTYLLARGIFSGDGRQILIAVGVLVLYGGILWGVLPTQFGVSWQAHLGGAVGGVLAAWWLHRRAVRRVG